MEITQMVIGEKVQRVWHRETAQYGVRRVPGGWAVCRVADGQVYLDGYPTRRIAQEIADLLQEIAALRGEIQALEGELALRRAEANILRDQLSAAYIRPLV